VYNASKAYADQLMAGEPYTKLEDVVAISICDFALWPDEEQQANGLPLVPMLSRWNMRERTSLNHGLLQIQYAFLELPKVPKEKPKEAGAALWAWLFVHAPRLSEIPPDLPGSRYGDALVVANQMTFTKAELEAYHKTVDEIEQLRVLLQAKSAESYKAGVAEGHKAGVAEGHKAGVAEGQVQGQAMAIFAIFAARNIVVGEETRARIAACKDASLIERWIGLAMIVASADELGA
ncbi:MAG TPA: PD-(D/E)XK nuclease family transposase, partial [Polyangium sp.]|nr:PD-(D/E)XK nuclease family transposase [Polyangium sp.]